MKGLLKDVGLEETKTCVSSKTREGCNKENPLSAFKVSSINENTGIVYRKTMCRQCELRDKKIQVGSYKTKETKLFNELNVSWR
jgi:hypothetical protein